MERRLLYSRSYENLFWHLFTSFINRWSGFTPLQVSFARRVNKVRLLKALIVKKLLSVNLCFLYYFTSPVLLPACSLLTIHTAVYSTAMPGRLSLVQNVALHVINKSNATKFGQFFFRPKTIQKTSFTSLKVGFVKTVAQENPMISEHFMPDSKNEPEMAALGVETSKSYLWYHIWRVFTRVGNSVGYFSNRTRNQIWTSRSVKRTGN